MLLEIYNCNITYWYTGICYICYPLVFLFIASLVPPPLLSPQPAPWYYPRDRRDSYPSQGGDSTLRYAPRTVQEQTPPTVTMTPWRTVHSTRPSTLPVAGHWRDNPGYRAVLRALWKRYQDPYSCNSKCYRIFPFMLILQLLIKKRHLWPKGRVIQLIIENV